MNLKDVFDKAEGGTLTYDQFMELGKEAKFVDLNEGEFVSKFKHQEELEAKDKQIQTLNEGLSTRDKDISDLKTKLSEAGADADKIGQLTKDLDDLKVKYETESKQWKEDAAKQAMEFAVKEHANSHEFSSKAAKAQYISQMTAIGLKMDKDNNLIGATDFDKKYFQDNSDSLKPKEDEPSADESNPSNPGNPYQPSQPKPQFAASTPGSEPAKDPTGGFASAMHFTTVRPMPAADAK